MSIGTHTPTPSLAASSTPTPTASATSATCSSDDLAASVGRSGAAAGTQITEIDFANTSNHPCDLSGVPALIGIRADGTQVALAFRGTSDPAYGIQPVTDGGVIQPGGTALIKATMQLNQCAVPVSTLAGFAQLGIRFPGGPSVTMPYPAALRSTGCPGNVSRVGLGEF